MWYIPLSLFLRACLGIFFTLENHTINLPICQHIEPSPVFLFCNGLCGFKIRIRSLKPLKLRFNCRLLLLLTIPAPPSTEWVFIPLSSPFANIEKANQEQTPLIGWKMIGLPVGEPSETTEKRCF